jgi:hypothetical protein
MNEIKDHRVYPNIKCMKCEEPAIKDLDILSDNYQGWNGKMFTTFHPSKNKSRFNRSSKIKSSKFVCSNCL